MRTRKKLGTAAAALTAIGLSVATASSASAAKATAAASSLKGQSINVAIAYPAPKADLAKFTAQTGIKVNWDYVQWDALQTKIAAAAQAHSYFADVADVDWSKVGEYYATKWFLPLNKYFRLSGVRSQFPQAPAFIRKGQLLGMPMDGSLLVTTMNEKYLKAAGVKKNPTTLAQYETDLKAIAAKTSAKHPLDIPFAAAEGLSTYWYEMTAAFGGNVLSANYKPLFTSRSSPGYKAMSWMINAYKSGLVPKANLSMQDYQALETDQAHGLTASVFSDYSGTVGTIYNVASESKVVGDVDYIPTPGAHGVGSNLGNPDGIGIPAQAKHVAAAVAFIKWMEQPANQAAFAGAKGSKYVIQTFPLPSNRGGLTDLVKSKKVPGAATLRSLIEHHAKPIFPAGAPPWYAQFSNAVYTNVHQAASGSESVSGAIKAIAAQVKSLDG
ncbi:MAG: extracellular solute-binding protein [Solirubrobacteraceae bacterium]